MGQSDELEAMMAAHWAPVLRLGFRMTGDCNEADEIGIEPPGERLLQIEEAIVALESADPRARQIVN